MAKVRIGGGIGKVRITGAPGGKMRIGPPIGTVIFAEFSPIGPAPPDGISDVTGTFSPPTGFTINDSNSTRVSMTHLSPSNNSYFGNHPNGDGYIWTATWGPGSTHPTTPVAMYRGAAGGITFWIIDPADGTLSSGTSGTFNFPLVLTPTSTPTSYQN